MRFDWRNVLFIVAFHVLAGIALIWAIGRPTSPWSYALAGVWYLVCGFGITAGYHRLFAHPNYRAHGLVRGLLLLGGAGSAQNSALKWSHDHRRHHSYTDTDRDPYSVNKGLFWAHIGWILEKDQGMDERWVTDLKKDRLVALQHRYYVPLAVMFGALVPGAIGFLWGDALGALLLAGPVRLVAQWHGTFTINSFAHYWGSRPYCKESSARDNALISLVTLGEGYHNFHHRFPADYRNGTRWYDWDPTKWLIAGLSHIGLTSDLTRTSKERIKNARLPKRAPRRTAPSIATPRSSATRGVPAPALASVRTVDPEKATVE